MTRWQAFGIPREKKLCLTHQTLNEQTTEQFGLDPGAARLFIIFGQTAQAQQALEMLKAQFDLPRTRYSSRFASVQNVPAYHNENHDELR